VTASYLDTSKLVALLQKSAVEHLTTFRQLEVQERGPRQAVVATEFEALYAYKYGEYQRCLRLAADGVWKLIGPVEGRPGISEQLYAHPELIQLMDDDLASLIGLTVIVQPCRRHGPRHVTISQLSLCLYLMTQCRIKLNHPAASLSRTLDFVASPRLYLSCAYYTLDQLILTLTECKICTYVDNRQFQIRSRQKTRQQQALCRELLKRMSREDFLEVISNNNYL